MSQAGEGTRLRMLTEKGQELYESNKEKFLGRYIPARDHLDSLFHKHSNVEELSAPEVVILNRELQTSFKTFNTAAKDLTDFFARMNMSEELEHHSKMIKLRQEKYDQIAANFDSQSQCSQDSNTSQSSSVAARKRAKAEASKARAAFARKELELKKAESLLIEQKKLNDAKVERQQQDIAAELAVLEEEKEAAAAEAEAVALESENKSNPPDSQSCIVRILAPPTDSKTRTAEFVARHPFSDTSGELGPDARPETISTVLLRRDLLSSRLTIYDERAENFPAWKASFKSVVDELSASPHEELDLLVKHLGPTSARYAQSIRACHTANPAEGLALLWQRLEDRYGSPERVEADLRAKIESFPTLTMKDATRLYDLCDIVDQIQAAKMDPKLSLQFGAFDSSSGMNTIIKKLPPSIKGKWVAKAANYKEENNVSFPPFSFLVDFLRQATKTANDPAFTALVETQKKDFKESKPRSGHNVFARSTDIKEEGQPTQRCPIHKANHTLGECKGFLQKTYQEKVALVKEKRLCFKCLESTSHTAKNCPVQVKCSKCHKPHHTAMHRELIPSESHGGEPPVAVEVKCTKLCGSVFASRSCGKIVPVTVFKEGGGKVRVYAVIDDQSNRSLASPALLDQLQTSKEQVTFTLTSCSGTKTMSGRRAGDLYVQSFDGNLTMKLPTLIECQNIPDERSEIPTPDVAANHKHLQKMASSIPQLEDGIPIGLLIGRDLPDAHHVLQQVVGPPLTPFAQRLPLGWVVIGDVCLDGKHKPSTVNVSKTCITEKGRGTIFEPCHNSLKVTEVDIFHTGPDDERIGSSVEDRAFLKIMDEKFRKNEEGRWTAPLPLKPMSGPVPNNRTQALGRARSLHAALRKDPTKQEHMHQFMAKILESGAAERAPPLEEEDKCWYLPFFGVYHPKKPGKIRGVFDSSATYEGLSLNSMLLSGPDLTNSLVGILMRFRCDEYAITADIEQMFYQFFVDEECRDLLRFFWYEDNDFSKPLIEYRMRVHVFGNSPSPAVATYGLRKTVEDGDQDVKDLVGRNFYVDDGVTSAPDAEQAVSLIQRAKSVLEEKGGLKLHKMASANREVLKALNKEDLIGDLKTVDLDNPSSPLPVHSCLGLQWDLERDTFLVNPSLSEAAFTRRGLLSILNSIFDPLGFMSPVTIAGKILLRKTCPDGKAWDEPLPEHLRPVWLQWKNAVESLGRLDVPRMYLSTSLTQTANVKLHIFCDASEQAISAVSYIETETDDNCEVGFVLGKAKLAPASGHSVPRLELCSAVLATELYQMILEHLSVPLRDVTFHTDSKVVLGYIHNETRRFHTYVSNRVSKIRGVSKPQQWKYIPTELNPADAATRGNLDGLKEKLEIWLNPSPDSFKTELESGAADQFPLISPHEDKEVRIDVLKTEVSSNVHPLADRYKRFSTWKSLVRAIGLLRRVCRTYHASSCIDKNLQGGSPHHEAENLETETFILTTVQEDAFLEEIKCLRQGRPVPASSALVSLSPYLDGDGLLRVGGRLGKAKETLGMATVHPVILPKQHHISTLLVRHFHEKVEHQGRHFTEGALRSGGYWIVGAKRLVASEIHDCFRCKRLRGKTAQQQMADLPEERVVPSAPFSHVGVDVFGPWEVLTRKTRGGAANSKRWAVVFTCLAIRAIHIELIEEMSSSSFINALTRFTSLRGPVVEFWSDRGSNFVGATNELGLETLRVESKSVEDVLTKNGTKWRFNPPHASHMGGVWERMIGIIRRILDSMLLDSRRRPLTSEVLSTLMSEVCAIVNNRPIAPITHDAEAAQLLTPSLILTQKAGDSQIPRSTGNMTDLYRSQWKQVQAMSDTFWKRWKDEYLQNLQRRDKWVLAKENIKPGSLVLMKDSQSHRNDWPFGLIVKVFPSADDGLVRSAEVRTVKNGKAANFIRPITELVMLEGG